MAAVMIAASVLTGRWMGAVPVRWPIFGGCVVFAAGLILTDASLSPHPSFTAVLLALLLTGAGIGVTVVPITSSALGAVPGERSGMAASATNTSREIGAVIGVAVLGSLVDAQLSATIGSRLHALGLPPNIQAIVISGIETGKLSGNPSGQAPPGQGKLVQEVIQAAYAALHAGLRDALYLSAALVLASGILALVTIRSRERPPESS
jgi:hypothetical protein